MSHETEAREVKEAIRKCRDALVPLFDGRIGFHPEPQVGVGQYQLSGSRRANAYDREPIRVLELLPDDDGASYWIAVNLRFTWVQGRTRLENAAASFFHGIAADPNKTPLFRAEWHDWHDAADRAAQPHWHVSRQPRRPPEPNLAALDDVPRVFGEQADRQGDGPGGADEPVQLSTPSLSRFHFAMCSSWASGEDRADGHRNRMDLEAVPIWLRRCIEYSREQLQSARR